METVEVFRKLLRVNKWKFAVSSTRGTPHLSKIGTGANFCENP
jgi:hypothetical protein